MTESSGRRSRPARCTSLRAGVPADDGSGRHATMVEPRIDATMTLRDGRTLGYAEYGDPGGTPGFYFHGHPGSRLEAQLAHEAALERGVRIIAGQARVRAVGLPAGQTNPRLAFGRR